MELNTSELVLLNGERFAEKRLIGNVSRLQVGRIGSVLPDATVELAAERSSEDVERLFGATETSRPELWEPLRWKIDRAVSARHSTDTGYYGHDFS